MTTHTCSVNTIRSLKHVWTFFNIIHERVNVKVQSKAETNLATKSSLKMMKDVFLFHVKVLLVLEIFTFLS